MRKRKRKRKKMKKKNDGGGGGDEVKMGEGMLPGRERLEATSMPGDRGRQTFGVRRRREMPILRVNSIPEIMKKYHKSSKPCRP
jgi:hypothetical protein